MYPDLKIVQFLGGNIWDCEALKMIVKLLIDPLLSEASDVLMYFLKIILSGIDSIHNNA